MSEVLAFPFARGIDEGASDKSLPTGTPLVMENRWLDKSNRARKRFGIGALATTILGGGSLAAGKRLVTRGDDLAVFDGTHLYTYVEPLASWKAIDRPTPFMVTSRPLVDSTRSVNGCDIAVSGDMLITLYEAGYSAGFHSIFVQVESVSTGAALLPPTLVGTGRSCPRVLVEGTTAHLLVTGGSAIGDTRLDLTTLTLAAEVDLVTDSAATPFDAVIGTATSGPVFYLVYELAAGADQIQLTSIVISTLLPDVVATPYAGVSIEHCCICAGAAYVVAIVSNAALGVRLITADIDLVPVVGPTTVDATWAHGVFVAEYAAEQTLVGWARDDGSNTDASRFYTVLYNATTHVLTGSTRRITFGIHATTKPWTVASRWFVAATTLLHPYSPTSTDPLPQSSVVVLEIETANSLTGVQDATHPHVATLANQTGWFTPIVGPLAKSAVAASGAVLVPAQVRSREPKNYADRLPISWTLHSLALATGDHLRPAVLASGALCAGGTPDWYDGETAGPYGFVHGPIIVSAAASAGGSVAAGVYGYQDHYSWRDANSVLHRSIPSPLKTGTTAAANLTLSPRVATASISSKQRTLFGVSAGNPVVIDTYRTTINGDTVYRLTLEPLHQFLASDPQLGDVTLTDTKADSNISNGIPAVTLASQAGIYTAGGILEDVPPPASLTVLAHKDRFWCLASDGHTVWPSKAYSEDPGVAPGFNEALTLYFADEKNALGKLDAATVVLGPNSIDFIAGLGPDATGAGGWEQRSMQTDRGCIQARSLATIPQGLLFQSSLGIELLGRTGELSWLGEAVKDRLAAYPTITSAVVVPSQHQVRFTCNDAAGTDGIVLVFDYVRGAWSVFDYGFAIADAALINDVYTILRSTGVVYRENTATHLDTATSGGTAVYVASAVEMPVSPSGPMAWHKVRHVEVMGTSVTEHQLTIRVARDFAASYEQSHTFVDGTDVTAPGPLERARMTLQYAKGQSFKFRIEDAAPADLTTLGIGAGPILEGLALYVQRKAGLPKITASRKG